VLFVSSCVLGGGAGWSLYYLLKYLDRSRIEPSVAVPEPGIFAERFRALGVRVHASRHLPHRFRQQRYERGGRLGELASDVRNLVDMARFTRELAGLVRREGIELVYANNMMVKPLGALAAQTAGVPCILHVRNIHEAPARIAFQNAVARLPSVVRLIANSSASAAPYARAVPDKIEVVHNGIDVGEYTAGELTPGTWRDAMGIGRDELVVGFTGNLIPRKGIEPLIRAAAQVLPRHPSARFVVLGRVPIGTRRPMLPAYEALVSELGLGARFQFHGFTPDVRPALVDFDVLTLPSLQEPFGRSIIEAMALGAPVVATRVGGVPEIITDGEHGLLVPPDDPRALADAIDRLLGDAALRGRLGAAGRERVRERFDVARLGQGIQDIILGAIAAR
jgi:glycosyltransferase involved in cell wall biosynthesis